MTTYVKDEILRAITPVISPKTDTSEREYRYLEPSTEREFEIQRVQMMDATSKKAVTRYFLYEMVPNGRVVQPAPSGALHGAIDARIKAAEEIGPNEAMGLIRDTGVNLEHLVKWGGGMSINSRTFADLAECAQSICDALNDNVRYDCNKVPTVQENVRRARQDAVQNHAYWETQYAQAKAALENQGVFKGCHDMFGRPLSKEFSRNILKYLNKPNQVLWNKIRGYVITGSGTLWQAWVANDVSAPHSGNQGYPTPKELRAAIRQAVLVREAETELRLKKASPTGLRLV